MERKVILLVRVSSDKQDTKAQRDELVAFVKQAGYAIREMDIIRNTESATKTEELRGLEQLKKDIDRYPIKHIYVWELSRISRRYEVLEEIRNTCIKRKINLTTKLERLTLLDPDGSINDDALDAYERYKMQVYREGKIRDARVKRGIVKAASQNRWLGGKDVLFGYAVDDKTKLFQIEPNESQIVKNVFDLYATELHSFSSIEKEILSRYSYQLDRKNLGRILNNPYYTGEKIKKEGYVYERQYPAIITKETFDTCQTLLKQRSNRKQDKSKNIFLAGRLSKCSCCGSTLVGYSTSNQYSCKKFHEKGGCNNGTSVNLNVVDSLALRVAWAKNYIEIKSMDEQKVEDTKEKINVLQQKIDNSEQQLNVIRDKKRKQLIDAFETKNIPDADVERAIREHRVRINNENINFQNEINRLQSYLGSMEPYWAIDDRGIEVYIDHKNIPLIEDMTDKERYDLVHQYVKNISITDIDNRTKEIVITTYCEEVSTFLFCHKAKADNKKLFEVTNVEGRLFVGDPNDREKIIEIGKGIYHSPISFKDNILQRYPMKKK